MQMEAEYADLFDRKMMALYGAQPGKGSLMDVTTKIGSKFRPKPYRVEAGNSPRMEDLDNATNNQSTHFLKGKRNSDYIPENDSGDGSDNEHADEMTKLGSVASGGIGSMRRITSVNDHI